MRRTGAAFLAVLGLSGAARAASWTEAGAFKLWTVQCDGGDHGGDPSACSGAAQGKLRPAPDQPGRPLVLGWNLGAGDWLEARRDFPRAVDLSSATAFHVRLRGVDSAFQANVLLMFSDEDGIFHEQEVDDFNGGFNQLTRWMVDRTVPREGFKYAFQQGTVKRTSLDWSRVRSLFLVIKRPCFWNAKSNRQECLGSGEGRIAVDDVSPVYGEAPEGRGLVSWPASPSLRPERDTLPSDGGPRWKGPALADASSAEGWKAVCERDISEQPSPARCSGLTFSDVSAAKSDGRPAVRLRWNLGAGRWAGAAYALPRLLDLSGARVLGFNLSGPRLDRDAAIILLLADDSDVHYGYVIYNKGYDLDHHGHWALRATLRPEDFTFHFNMAVGGERIDWSRISKFFLIVQKQGDGEGSAGELLVESVAYGTKADWAGRPAPARAAAGPPSQWFGEVSFPRGEAGIPDKSRDDVEKIARLLLISPDRDAVVEGFAAEGEPDAARLAAERARRLRDALRDGYGVPEARLRLRARGPEAARGGAPRVLVYFSEEKP